MGKFIFRLQSLLNIKSQTEESIKNELGKALKKIEEERHVLVKLENESEDCIYDLNKGTFEGIKVDKILKLKTYLQYLNEKIVGQKEYINDLQDNADRIRERLLKIMQERKMLDKLKEHKFQDYLYENERSEQKILDEIAGNKFARKTVGEKSWQ